MCVKHRTYMVVSGKGRRKGKRSERRECKGGESLLDVHSQQSGVSRKLVNPRGHHVGFPLWFLSVVLFPSQGGHFPLTRTFQSSLGRGSCPSLTCWKPTPCWTKRWATVRGSALWPESCFCTWARSKPLKCWSSLCTTWASASSTDRIWCHFRWGSSAWWVRCAGGFHQESQYQPFLNHSSENLDKYLDMCSSLL